VRIQVLCHSHCLQLVELLRANAALAATNFDQPAPNADRTLSKGKQLKTRHNRVRIYICRVGIASDAAMQAIASA
jgi:hypothetical protein